MISFLNIDTFAKGLTPVTSAEYFSRRDEFHSEGLFSEIIFGVIGSMERKQTFSFINLHAKVAHPTVLEILLRLDKKIEKFFSTELSFSLTKEGTLVVDEKGVTGISEFIKLFPKIKFRTGTQAREKFVDLLHKEHKKGTLFIDKIPVIPPDFRPAYLDEATGEWIIDKLNDVYQGILRRTFQLRSSGPGPLFDLLNYALQNAVKDHDKFIRSRVEKKHGLIRQQMLGKRVDFSGRAVITPGPELKIDEVGIPMRLAVGLFEPFIIHQLLYKGIVNKEELEREIKAYNGLELSVDTVQRLLKGIKAGDELPESLFIIFFEATERAMMGRVVLVKRDPVLHTTSYMAYKPVLHRGNTIKLCTLQVGPHNADFDGDTMAVFHPLTDEAQEEAKAKMMTGVGGSKSTSLNFELSNEMWAGLFTLTKDKKSTKPAVAVSDTDLEEATNPYIPVRYRGKTTTMGRAIFNSCFPSTFPFQDISVTKKVGNKIIQDLAEKYDMKIVKESVSKIERVAFKWATIMSPTITLDILELPPQVYKIKEKIKGSTPEEADALIKEAEAILTKYLADTGFGDLIQSGAGKGMTQAMQILVAKGIVSDPQGRILDPIAGSYSDGLSNTEFFKMSSGGRKGIIDRVLNTADTGYLSRKLAFVLNSVEADPYLLDCKTKKTLTVKLTQDLMTRLSGRYLKGASLFDPSKHKPGEVIELRSPIYCKSKKICFRCYGNLLKRHKSPYVGVLAAQAIGERGTQMIMRTFHTGGAVELIKRDILQDIVDNDPVANLDKKNLSRYLNQEENILVNKQPCTLTLNLSNYTLPDSIRIGEKKVWVRSLISKVEFEDLVLNVVLDYPVDIHVHKIEEKNKQFVKLSFPSNSTFLEVSVEAAEIKGQVAYVERLLGGREILKDPPHLYKKVLNVYSPPLTDMDSVHLEVLCSQVLRNRTNIHEPARLIEPYDPVLINIKKVVFSGGFLQGLAFENVGEAIRSGLIAEEDVEPSIIEQILTGEVGPQKKGR